MTNSPTQTRRTEREWMEDWVSHAMCRGGEPDALFVAGSAQQAAKRVCLSCPVIAECLAEALDHRTEFGVWGGMTERERRAILRRHPDIPSWRALFERNLAESGLDKTNQTTD